MKLLCKLAFCAVLLSPAAGCLGQDATGPTPFPKDQSAWPGSGVIRVFPWMADNRNFFWQHRSEKQGAVVFVGDSILGNWTDVAKAFPKLPVANRAIGGDVTRGVLFRLKEDVLDIHPKAIVLLIGSNDLSAKEDSAIAAANISAILDQIAAQSPAPPVILCTVLPRQSPEAPIDPAKVPELNNRIKELAKARRNVTLVDTFPQFAMPDGSPDLQYFRPDHLHLAAPGYERMRQTLEPVLAKL